MRTGNIQLNLDYWKAFSH